MQETQHPHTFDNYFSSAEPYRFFFSTSRLVQALASSSLGVGTSQEARHFKNNLADYPQDGNSPLVRDLMPSPRMAIQLSHARSRACSFIRRWMKNNELLDDFSVYTGGAGIAYMFVRLASRSSPDDAFSYLADARICMRSADRELGAYESNPSRLQERGGGGLSNGAAGLYLVRALAGHVGADATTAVAACRGYAAQALLAVASDSDDWRSGRAGYLYGCLALRQALSPTAAEPIDEEVLGLITSKMMDSGRRLAESNGREGLMFLSDEKENLGATKGLAGILYMLLHVPSLVKEEGPTLQRAVDFLLSQELPSGNFPVDVGDSDDLQVQFCRGAPGVVYVLVKAWQVFGREDYLEAALRAGDLIWTRGLLRKGPGLCHGIAGNGYAFLCLLKATKDPKHLHRALQFASFLFSKQAQEGSNTPDHPYSLFEGLAGAVCFLLDIENPMTSAFPLFELPQA